MIEEALYYQRHRLRAFCGYSEEDIDNLDISRGIEELGWLHDHEMQERINMFSSHGIDVQNVKTMGTTYYRDYIMKKKDPNYKEDMPAEIEKFKGGFDDILKSKRGV